MSTRLTERVQLPDGTWMEGPLIGQQMPRLWNVPPRHEQQETGCVMCALEAEEKHGYGCGDGIAEEVLEWAEGFGYELDPWQKWCLRHMLGVKPSGLWSALNSVIIVSRQNGKGTILEVRELAGIFLLQEELIIHTAHQFKTTLNHMERLKETLGNYPSLMKRVKARGGIVSSNGKEAIVLKPRPVSIWGSTGKEMTRRRSSKIQFHARAGSATSRGFSCDCLVYDEAMILTEEQVGASLPTMSAMPNPHIIYAASAGLEDASVSTQLAKVRGNLVKHRPSTVGGEWSVNPHDDGCPRDDKKGRETNYYIVCDKHDDRDDPRAWAKANPGMGYRISPGFTRFELETMPPRKFDIERLAIGNWPSEEEPWETITKPAWKILTNEDPGFPTPPMVLAFDVSEDGQSATVMGSWEHKQHRTVIEMPLNGHRQGTGWVIDFVHEKYLKRRPLAIAVPKSGPAAGLLDAAINKWGDRVYPVGPGEEAAAFAFLMQQVKDQQLWHFGEELAPTLWHAVGRAGTRVVGDGGKAWCRRDAEADISPITAGTIAAYVLNKKRRSYDLSNTIA
jgi:hypothetical protein